jgi:hypothetical protein
VRYDQKKIETILNDVLIKIGPDRFSAMKVVALEQYIRASNPTEALPARTQLRAAIHAFRTARWPETAPSHRRLSLQT